MRDINTMEFVKALGNGWNLGNTLDAVSREDSQDPSVHETAWGNPVTKVEVANLLKKSGFDIFRVPTSWGKHLGGAPDYTINKAWMDRVQEVVDYGISNELYVILNLHHEHWHFPSEENFASASAIIERVWTQIAERFKNYDEKLIFETMNEPRLNGTPNEWNGGTPEAREIVNKLNEIALKAIRSTGGNNALRKVMLPTYAASSEDSPMEDLRIPDDKNIIASVHSYTPYSFALAPDGTPEWSCGNPSDTKPIDVVFERLNKHFLSKGIPVILGELGAQNRGENTEARVAWAKYYTEKARSFGVPCIWWDNNTTKGSGEKFGLMDRVNAEWLYPEVVEAFVKA